MRKKPPSQAERREWGRMGGKRSLETMTKAARISRAYQAGVQGGRPVVIDYAKVLELRAADKMGREIAADLGISEPSVWRILWGRRGKR